MDILPTLQSQDSDTDEDRKPLLLKRGLLVYSTAILAIGWSYALWQTQVDRTLTLAASSNQLTMTATALANHVTAMIHDGVGAAVAGSNEIAAAHRARQLSANDMSAVLARMLTGGDYVSALFIATPTHYAIAQRELDVASERPKWLNEMLAATGATWVGHPLNTEQGDAHILIPIAKRVGDIDDKPTWAGALLSMSTVDTMYRNLPIEYSGVALDTFDGTLLIRIPTLPGTQLAGTNVRGYEAYRVYMKNPRPLSVFDAPDPLTGKLRQYAARHIEGYPFFAAASRNHEDSLIAWRSRTRNSIIMMAVASLAFIGLTLAFYTLLQRRFEALRRSEERFQLAVNGSNDGIWDWEIKSNRVYYSPRFKQHLGYSHVDDFPPVPDTFWQRIHPNDFRTAELAVNRHLLHRDPYDIEYRLQTRDGSYRWFRARGQATWDERGEAIRMAGAIGDIHDSKSAEAALEQARTAELHAREEFAQRLLLAHEQERQRLANELHDSVGQNLSLIKNHALLVLQEANLSPDTTRHTNALSALATEVIVDVRAVAQNLRPLHVEELGITDAIETLLKKVRDSNALAIDTRIENVNDALLGDAATHLYRIMQESLNNTLKHSRAKLCKVTLERDLHCVRLMIADDGLGFDMDARKSRGLGLSSIAERVRMLNATWQFSSAIGKGTSMRIEIPIPSDAPADESIPNVGGRSNTLKPREGLSTKSTN